MNLYHTNEKINDMIMIGINGPPLTAWNLTKYVISWLKLGKCGALVKATELPKNAVIIKHSSTLLSS